ncbi:protein TolQ [Robiginitomaculum antarcticum]|uniref:protein TolQ n=1 Tax=Robiginitomaculum antarcticum TaxID=437507 RepID=UPI00037003C1|nr:protein TolQ [Robiginitomaculum antarcticum]
MSDIALFTLDFIYPLMQVETSALDPVSTEFSIPSLFLKADIIVKLVIISLVVASLWSWVIIVDKFIAFRVLKKRAADFEETFWSGRTLEELDSGLSGETRDPMGRVFAAAMREWKESRAASGRVDNDLQGTRGRLDRVMNLVVNRELTKAESGLSVLATIASASPFIGLLGTVWGIMVTFRAIYTAGSTDLIVILPGIAEALFATALGLIAAIPAVVFYNKFNGDLNRYASRLEGYTDELSAILSRKLAKGGA